jgi:hypothetical protein
MIKKNEQGETLEFVSDLVLNLDYWDCECENNYIHKNSVTSCNICKTNSTNQPNSRDSEVLLMVKG